MTLPLVISPGDVGHIANHEEIDTLLEQLDGQTDYLASGVAKGLRSARGVAGASNDRLLYWSTDGPSLGFSDGVTWSDLALIAAEQAWSAAQDFGADVFFGSGRPWVDPKSAAFGAVGDGSADDTVPIENAIKTGDDVLMPDLCKVTRPFAVPNVVHPVLLGRNRHNGFQVQDRTVVYCKGVTGFLFSVGSGDQTKTVSLVGVSFDGTNGNRSLGNESTTFLGLFTCAKISSPVAVRFVLGAVAGASDASAIGFDARNLVWLAMFAVQFSFFTRGHCIRFGATGTTSTTLSLTKVLMQYSCLAIRADANVTDLQLRDFTVQSCTAVYTGIALKVLWDGCYFENIGYTSASGPFAANLPLKNMGVGFGAGTLDTALDTAFSDLYGSHEFLSCRFAALAAAGPLVAWFRGSGLGSGVGSNGGACFTGCTSGEPTFPFLKSEQQSGYVYEVQDNGARPTSPGSLALIKTLADARLLTRGTVLLAYSVAPLMRLTKVERGLLRLGELGTDTYTATGPADSPTGGGYVVGDTCMVTTPAAGGYKAAVCTGAGTPGTWKGWGVIQA